MNRNFNLPPGACYQDFQESDPEFKYEREMEAADERLRIRRDDVVLNFPGAVTNLDLSGQAGCLASCRVPPANS